MASGGTAASIMLISQLQPRLNFFKVVLTVMNVLLVSQAAPALATKPKQPSLLVVYAQEKITAGPDTTAPAVGNSSGAVLVAANMPLTIGPSPSSFAIGRQFGTASFTTSAILNGPTQFVYLSFDHYIAYSDYEGTFLIQGAGDIQRPNRTLAIIGGTGDFYLARGYAIVTSPNTSIIDDTATARYECHFVYT